jgi:hypothetical protein
MAFIQLLDQLHVGLTDVTYKLSIGMTDYGINGRQWGN